MFKTGNVRVVRGRRQEHKDNQSYKKEENRFKIMLLASSIFEW